MPNSPSSSFIPKQGPAKRSRQVVSRQVHVFTVISYVLFFGALAASVGVFLYSRHTDNQLKEEITGLDTAIANFSNEKMEQVKAFNLRLIQAQERVYKSVSTVSIFESLEAATAKTIAIESLTLKRIGDEKFQITAEVSTDTFDSALFQRGLYERNSIVEKVSFEDLSLGDANSEEEGLRSGISFKAELEVPLNTIPYNPDGIVIPVTDNTVLEISTSTEVVGTSTKPLSVNDSRI